MASNHHKDRYRHPSGKNRYFSMCRVWIKVFSWFPVLLIVGIVGWSYYAYVFQLCFGMVQSLTERVLFMFFFHVLFFMFLWAYWQTIYTSPRPIPLIFKLSETEMEHLLAAENEEAQMVILENFAKDLPVYTRTASGALRYCNRCIIIKPDRAHHCSMCGKCVLKMDHHCPWVNNCVNFHNYKYFVLFLGYALLYCVFITCTTFPYFLSFWRSTGSTALNMQRFHVLFVFFVALMFATSLGSLWGYHLYLVLNNRSTLEAFRAPVFRGGPDKNGFSLGAYKNFVEVFGDQKILWMFPIFTSLGDGSDFPVRLEHQIQNYNNQDLRGYESMGTTRSSEEQGIEIETRRLYGDHATTANNI